MTRVRDDGRDRFVCLEAHLVSFPRELPVHREREWRPVGLDDPLERRDAVLGTIGRAFDPEIVGLGRPEQVAE